MCCRKSIGYGTELCFVACAGILNGLTAFVQKLQERRLSEINHSKSSHDAAGTKADAGATSAITPEFTTHTLQVNAKQVVYMLCSIEAADEEQFCVIVNDYLYQYEADARVWHNLDLGAIQPRDKTVLDVLGSANAGLIRHLVMGTGVRSDWLQLNWDDTEVFMVEVCAAAESVLEFIKKQPANKQWPPAMHAVGVHLGLRPTMTTPYQLARPFVPRVGRAMKMQARKQR